MDESELKGGRRGNCFSTVIVEFYLCIYGIDPFLEMSTGLSNVGYLISKNIHS